jgi:hypothetical protein
MSMFVADWCCVAYTDGKSAYPIFSIGFGTFGTIRKLKLHSVTVTILNVHIGPTLPFADVYY